MKSFHVPMLAAKVVQVFCVGVIASAISAQNAKPVPELRLNEPLEFELSGNEPRDYSIDLKAKEFVQVRVEQRGIDVVLRLFTPDGKMAAEIDTPTGEKGHETLSWIARTAGRYRFQVARSQVWDNSQSGAYEIKLTAQNPATKQNQLRLKAETLFAKTEKPTVLHGPEIPELVKQYKVVLKAWEDANDEYMTYLLTQMIANFEDYYKRFSQSQAETAQRIAAEEIESTSGAKLVVQTGHTNTVDSVTLSPDKRMLVSKGSISSEVIIWDTASGQELKSMAGHLGFVTAQSFSNDSRRLALGMGNGSIRIMDTQTGATLRVLDAGSPSSLLIFLPDGKSLVSADSDSTLRRWDFESGRLLKSLPVGAGLFPKAFSPSGTTLATVRDRDSIVLVDVSTGKVVRDLGRTPGALTSIAISADGKRVVSAGFDNMIRIWNVQTGAQVRAFAGHKDFVSGVLFSPDGRQVLSFADYDADVKWWDVETGELRQKLRCSDDWVASFALSRDGQALACGTFGTIGLWTGQPLKQIRVLGGDAKVIESVAFSPDESGILSAGGSAIKLWSLGSEVRLTSLVEGHTFGRLAVLSPDGNILASDEQTPEREPGHVAIRLWNMKEGRLVSLLNGHERNLKSIAFAPDGQTLVSGGLDNKIKVWSVATGQELRSFENDAYSGSWVAYSPDGETIAAGGSKDCVIRRWNAKTGEELTSLVGENEYVKSIGFSNDGNLLASGNETGTIQFWNTRTGERVRVLKGHASSVDSIAFSPDGERLVSASADYSVRIWSVADGRLLKTLLGHTKNVKSVTFSPDGKFILSGGWDATMKLWDANGQPLATLIALDKNDWTVVTPDGLFDASPGARRLMHYVVGLEPIRLEQMKEIYYVPGLLQRILKGEALPKVKLFTAKDLFPLVEYHAPQRDQVAFDAQLVNRGGGIGQVQLFINGKECGEESGVNVRPPGFSSTQPFLTMHIDIKKCGLLLAGEENKVEIVTYNAAGSINSRGSTRGIEFISQGIIGLAAPQPPNIFIIGGGVSRYTGANLNLSYAAQDAEDFTKALELGAVRLVGADRVHVRLLTSNGERANVKFTVADAKISSATKAGFERAFTDFKNATPNDLFIVYLAGHGVSIQSPSVAGGNTYLYLTQEATSTDSSVLAVSNSREAMAISSDELAELMKQNKALKQVLVLDTCAAGAAAESFATKRDLPSDQIKAIDRLQNRIGFFVLMGSAADKTSYETTQYGHGLLTYSLLYGVKGGVKLREDKFADIASLFTYAQDQVPELATDIGGIQRPIVISPPPSIAFDNNGSFDIGMFTPAEQTMIKLSAPKPWLLRPVLLNRDENYDDLGLTPLIREALRSAPNIAFVDGDEMPGALKPTGSYVVERDSVTINLRLSRNGFPIGDVITVRGSRASLGDLVRQLAALIQDSVAR